MHKNFILLILMAFVGVGCQNVTKQYTRIPDFVNTPVQPGTSRIFVYRERGAIGTAPIFINDSGTPIGDLFMGGYLVWDRTAGHGALRAKLQINQEPDVREVDFEAGQTYYFLARLVPGYVGKNSRASITPLDSGTAATIGRSLAPPIN
jgi:hypothetical protein